MKKKVLIISSSPRRGGNSDLLCDEFARGAAESGHTVEKLTLSNQNIGYCTGCGVCNRTHKCVQKDDMEGNLEKMISADVIVLATPVYFYTMCAQMKTFIDRMVPRYTEITGKEFYFIVAAADADVDAMEKTIEGLRGLTEDCLKDPVEKGIIYGVGAWQIGDIKGSRSMEQAYQTGKEIA